MKTERDTVDRMLAQWGRERPDLDSSGMAVVLRILLLAGLLSERLKDVLAPLDLAPFEFDVLSALRRAGTRGVTPGELCESAQLTSGAMTHRLDRLQERGLVTRRPSRTDRRSFLVFLTGKGRALVDQAVAARMDDAAACIRALTKLEQRKLAQLLRRVHLELAP